METALLCEVPIGQVEDELVGLAGQLSAGLCRWLLLLGEFDRREGWAGWGISSCVHWLSIRLAISASTARAQLAVAHSLAGLLRVTEHFAAGELSYSQVRALCRVADAHNEAELIELARNMNADQLERMCRLLRGLDNETDAEAAASTSLVARWGDDGTATIRVRLPNEDATGLLAAVEERLRKIDLPDTLPWEARRAQALIEVVSDGAAVTTPSRERPLVHITVPLADLEAGQGGTINGRPIAEATVRRMLCDGAVVGVVVDASGKPVAMGNKARVPSTKVQRAVDVRDGKRCTYPGCGRPAEETHHVLHWVDGHRTEVDLLTSQCVTTTGLITAAGSTSTSTRPPGRFVSPAPTAVPSSRLRPRVATTPTSPPGSPPSRAPSRPTGTAALSWPPSWSRRSKSTRRRPPSTSAPTGDPRPWRNGWPARWHASSTRNETSGSPQRLT